MNFILRKLSKGDLRQKGCSEEVVEEVLENNQLFSVLIEGMKHKSAGVRMRASDAAEKITRDLPQLLQPYKNELLNDIAKCEQQEVRWHLAQMLPRLSLTSEERKQLYELMKSYLSDKSRIVTTFAMQALADIAKQDDSFRADAIKVISKLQQTGSPAMKSRGKKLLNDL